jgi:uncharacterized protein
MTKPTTPDCIIRSLGLIPHPEGGYFRETYRSGAAPMASKGSTDPSGSLISPRDKRGSRNLLTSIYWMPTRESPIAWWCNNLSDHIHYYHLGDPLTYHLLDEDGRYTRHVLGPDLDRGQLLQLVVPSNCWKAAELEAGEFTLLAEAVAPGFDFGDFSWVTAERLQQRMGENARTPPYALSRWLKPDQSRDFERYYD